MADTDIHLSESAIRERSYLIWEREGRPQGKALVHWSLAKAELEAELRAGNPIRKPLTLVMPRIPISLPPNKSVAARIGRAQPIAARQ